MTVGSTSSWRPATVFLSYKREDAEEVKYLQQQLKVRGVRAWRDVTNMSLGGATEEEVVRAIERESDAFVIYITRQCLASDYVWNIEVPAALRRRKDDPSFNIIPIFRNVTTAEVKQICENHGYRSLTDFNGKDLHDRSTGKNKKVFFLALREVARRTLDATLDLRLRRVEADRSYEPQVCFRTFSYEPPTASLDLDLDWREFIDKRFPTIEEWQDVLLPALQDVKESLSVKTSSGKLHVFLKAVLPAAFAFGYVFSATSPFTLFLEGGDYGTWSTKETVSDPSPLRYSSSGESGDASTAIVEIAVSRGIALDIARSLPSLGISFGHRVRFDLEGGADDEGVRDAAIALAMARQIRKELKRLCDTQGILHLHLFASIPAALAVIIGHQFNALGKITFYHHSREKKIYTFAYTLDFS